MKQSTSSTRRVILPRLKEGAVIHWNFLWLAIFGLLAAIVSMSSVWQGIGDIARTGHNTSMFLDTIRSVFQDSDGGFLGGVSSTLLFIIFMGSFFLLGSVGQIAIIDTAHRARKNIRTSFRAAWAVRRVTLWNVFSLHVVLHLLLFLISFGIGTTLLALPHDGVLSLMLGIILFIILLITSLTLSIVGLYAVNALVIRRYRLMEAIADAAQLIRKHWLLSVEVAIIFLVCETALGIIWIFLSAILFVPFTLLGALFMSVGVLHSATILLNLWLFLIFIMLIILVALYSVWNNAVWTLLYLDLHADAPLRSVCARLLERFRT